MTHTDKIIQLFNEGEKTIPYFDLKNRAIENNMDVTEFNDSLNFAESQGVIVKEDDLGGYIYSLVDDVIDCN